MLGFQYPETTPQGHFVEVTENQEENIVRAHFRSKDSHEVYFEITKYPNLSAQMEYERHKENLEKKPERVVVTDLKEIRCMVQTAYEYSLRWSRGSRIIRLIEIENVTYRILYDPKSHLNVQMLSTLRWKY